jgi:hypothetical protein
MPGDKYTEIFTGKVGLIGNNPGHGFANVTVKPEGVTGTFRMNLPYEVQCTLPYKQKNTDGSADTEESFYEKIKQKFKFSENKYQKCVKKYWTFPKELTWEEYGKLKQDSKEEAKELKLPVSVGLDYVDFYPVTVDLEKSHVIAIYGKKEFGKTNLLNLLLSGFARQNKKPDLVFR